MHSPTEDMWADPVMVRTAGGAIEGRRSASVVAFLGVPFAAPPFGVHRMRPPQPVTPWEGIRPARRHGPTAPKGDYPAIYRPYFREIVVPGDECLNLNVWTPAAGPAGLPVMVWIHGGSFANGSGSLPEYAGWAFARDGVVCVTINYRLGIEGFLDFDDGQANLGLQDQIAALEWVQENIESFGGDPSKVTVAGESAGAMSVACLVSSPAAEGLFARAIVQSGYAADTLSPAQASGVATFVAQTFGVRNSRGAIRDIPRGELATLSAEMVDELELNPDVEKWGDLAAIGSPFSPTVDGNVLPLQPIEAFRRGRGDEVAVMIGSNRDEVRLTLVAGETLDAVSEEDLRAAAEALGLSAAGLQLYREAASSASPGDLLAAISTDWTYTLSPIRIAEARARTANTWVYRFDHPEAIDNAGLAACHAVELPFVFDCIDLPDVRPRVGASPRQDVADLTHGIWVDFIHGRPGWQPYDLDTRSTALIATTVKVVDDPTRIARVAWEGVR